MNIVEKKNDVWLLLDRNKKTLWIFVDETLISVISDVTGVLKSKYDKNRYIVLSHGICIGLVQNVIYVMEQWGNMEMNDVRS